MIKQTKEYRELRHEFEENVLSGEQRTNLFRSWQKAVHYFNNVVEIFASLPEQEQVDMIHEISQKTLSISSNLSKAFSCPTKGQLWMHINRSLEGTRLTISSFVFVKQFGLISEKEFLNIEKRGNELIDLLHKVKQP